ncbi:hypothetical protein CSB69_2352 [Morganella morganii]|nr:hypothetical protein CSB69_2352 [Morganella morganii]EMP50507.1 hypothetical protein C790_02387 [Morganella morganii SC01]
MFYVRAEITGRGHFPADDDTSNHRGLICIRRLPAFCVSFSNDVV